MTQAVLILDDEASISMLISKVVSRLGFEVECVERGEDAVALVQQRQDKGERFALLILDLTLPNAKQGGFEALHAIRAIDPTVPAMATSGYVEQERTALEQGFNLFLGKPFNLNQLAECVEKMMSSDELSSGRQDEK